MQLTNACAEPQEHTTLQNHLRTAHGNGFNELCTTRKGKSDCTIKSDQHNLHQQNYCIITEIAGTSAVCGSRNDSTHTAVINDIKK